MHNDLKLKREKKIYKHSIGDLVIATSVFGLESRILAKGGPNYYASYSNTDVGQLLLVIDAKNYQYMVQPTDSDQTFFCLRWHLDTCAEVVSNG